MDRIQTIALIGLLTLAGCRNMGLDYAGPEDEAVTADPTELVAAVHARAAEEERRPLIVEGKKWVPSGRPLMLNEDEVTPVGSAGGRTVYARSWDDSPYEALFARGEDGTEWRTYLPVLGGGGGPPSGTAGSEGEGGSAPGH